MFALWTEHSQSLILHSLALQVVQRNLRKYLQNKNWAWFRLWQKVKPLLNVVRVEDVIAVSIAPFSAHI